MLQFLRKLNKLFYKKAIRHVIYSYIRLIRPEIIKIHNVNVQYNSKIITSNILKFIVSGGYEKDEKSIITKNIKGNEIVLEIGCGIGVVSTLIAKSLTHGRLYAFDANPVLVDITKSCLKLNQALGEVLHGILLNNNLSDAIDFYIHEEFWSSSTQRSCGTIRKIKTPVYCLNKFLEDNSIDTLVVDIEGGEVELFEETDLSRINKMIIEVHPEKVDPLLIGKMIYKISEQKLYLNLLESTRRVFFFERASNSNG